MKLEAILKTSLDELRMQMLGAQALFGFQFQGLFQDNFESVSCAGRLVDAAGLGLMVMVLGLIVAVPCQHRIIDQGEATSRILRVSLRYSKYTLAPLAAAVSCNIYVVLRHPFGNIPSLVLALCAFLGALGAWYLLGILMRRPHHQGVPPVQISPTSLHVKIEQLLTEARVILPGAQALLGFQFVVMMTQAFDRLPAMAKSIHLIALLSLVVTIILLIAPAAIHRVAFDGRDDPRLHSTGSVIVTLALLPLAVSICCDLWVALFKLNGRVVLPTVAALGAGAVLLCLWFLIPYIIRTMVHRPRRLA